MNLSFLPLILMILKTICED